MVTFGSCAVSVSSGRAETRRLSGEAGRFLRWPRVPRAGVSAQPEGDVLRSRPGGPGRVARCWGGAGESPGGLHHQLLRGAPAAQSAEFQSPGRLRRLQN